MSNQKLWALSLVAVLAACGGAASSNDVAGSDSQDQTERPPLPGSVLPVPIVRQIENYTCGAASTSAIFKYWQVADYDGDYHTITGSDLLDTTPANGTDPENIVITAQKFGLKAEFKSWKPSTTPSAADARREAASALADLRAALAAKRTVILDLQAWSGETTPHYRLLQVDGHYVVLIGMDATDDGNLYVMDPDAMKGDSATKRDPDAYTYLPIRDFTDRWHDYEDGPAKTKIKFRYGRIVIWSTTQVPVSGPPRSGPLLRME